jgi:NADH dehydrogenase FAD-containing subunit
MTHNIVVLGGGYTGTMCAIRLARRTRRMPEDVTVTLVNPSERFTERLRMHQIATGQRLKDIRLPDLLAGTGVTFVKSRAVALGQHVVSLENGRSLSFDTLVFAIGSVADTHSVPGAGEFAYTLDTPADAKRLSTKGTVAVCGGGLTGIESAAEIAEQHPAAHVVLLSRDNPGWMMSPKARAYLEKSLARLGVEVRAGVEVTKVLPDGLELSGGETLPVDACLWTVGFVPPPLAREAGLAVDAHGRIVVDETLRSVSHPSIYAIGDSAAVTQPWGVIHGTCQSGIPTGVYAADAIVRRLRGKRVKPFRFGYIHQPVSLGRRDAVIQFTKRDDRPGRWFLTGRAARIYKEVVTSSPPPTYRLSKRLSVPLAMLRRP